MDLYSYLDRRIHIVPSSDSTPNKSNELITHQVPELVDLYSDSSQQTTSEYQDVTNSFDPEVLNNISKEMDRMSLISQSTTTNVITDKLSEDGSNQLTPSSKILNFTNIDPETSKRSFSRFKQTGELVNTERVYLASLEILKRDYIDNFMSDVPTPVFFETFKACITQMIENHQTLYINLKRVYTVWANQCLTLNKDEDLELQLKSPAFNAFHYIPQNLEHEHLFKVIQLLENDSINVSCYGEYCSLFNRIVSFSIKRGIENYKRNSIAISNDYIVSHRNLQQNIFIDQRLDTRFISVVQMPTNRITRYKLMIGSLLKNIHLDESPEFVNSFKQSELKLGELVDNVNHYVGESNRKYEQLDEFKKIFDGTAPKLNPKSSTVIYTKCPLSPLFFDNLSFINLDGSLTLVYFDDDLNRLVSFNAIAAVFDSHLIIGKPSSIYQGKAEILLALPLISILNHKEIISNLNSSNVFYTLATQYESTLNITFENNFKVHEIALVFVNQMELNIWIDYLSNSLKNNSTLLNNFKYEWNFSSYQQKIQQLNFGKEVESFSVSGHIPMGMSIVKSTLRESMDVHVFEVDMFNVNNNNGSSQRGSITSGNNLISSGMNSPYKRNISKTQLKRESSTLSFQSQKTKLVKVTLPERVACQTCLGDLWNPSLIKYELNIGSSNTFGTLGRSFSTFFFRNEDNSSITAGTSAADENESVLQPPPMAFGRGLKKSDSISSFGSFLQQPSSIFGGSDGPQSLIERSPFKKSKSSNKFSGDVGSITGTPRTPKSIRHNSNIFATPKSLQSIRDRTINGFDEPRLDPVSPMSPRSPISISRKRDRIGKVLGLGVYPEQPPKRCGSENETLKPPNKIPKSSSMMSVASIDSRTSTRSNLSNFFKGVIGGIKRDK